MARVPRTCIDVVFLGLLLAIGTNALLYAARAANPLIAADAWHSIDTIVRSASSGDLSLGDLFAKRSAFDHSQPLRKLILLFHYRWFDLDYGIEALIGVLAAFVNLGVFWLMLRAPREGDERHPPSTLLGFAALAAVYLSLNAAVVFNWPLLTLNYTSHLFVLLFLWAAWRGYQRADRTGLALLFASALLMDVVADDTGLVATLAAMLSLALLAWRERRWRVGGLAIAATVAAYLVYKAFYAWIVAGAAHAGGGVSLGNRITGLLNHADGIVQWISVPLVAALAHRVQLRDWLGADTTGVELAIALLMLVAHAWFWWRAFAGRRNLPSFVATALMLLFYGLVAGMLVARVSLQGSDYLWQPRYVLIYEWHLVALLLMALGQVRADAGDANEIRTGQGGRFGRPALVVAAVLLLLLQLPWSWSTWSGLKYVSAYQQRMASALGAIARDPSATPQGCAPQLLVCRYDVARRTQVVRFLQSHHLNLFSPAFRARNRLYPDADALPQ